MDADFLSWWGLISLFLILKGSPHLVVKVTLLLCGRLSIRPGEESSGSKNPVLAFKMTRKCAKIEAVD